MISLLRNLSIPIPDPQREKRWKGLEDTFIPKGKELEELWRMELFTQDHNYAGKNAIFSESFKLETKKKILDYTKEWIEMCLKALGENASLEKGMPVILFNPLSWQRKEIINIPKEILPEEFSIIDEQGNSLSYEKSDDLIRVEVSLPPIGYQILYVRENISDINYDKDDKKNIYIADKTDSLVIGNRFYELKISKRSGEITSIFDKDVNQELLDREGLGALKIYTEEGTDVAERSTHLEINWDIVGRDVSIEPKKGDLTSTILIKKRLGLFNAQIEDQITLYKDIKKIDITTVVTWGGFKSFQVRYVFPFRKDLSTIIYGTPFYAVRYPETMDGIKGPWKADELTFEDWEHIRDISNWIDLSNDKFGVTLSSLSSSYYINPGELQAVLFRTVKSCGDFNYHYNTEFGKRFEFKFTITSGPEDWKIRRAYEKGLEMLNPVIITICDKKTNRIINIPEKLSFFDIQTDGIVVTSIQPEENGTVIRYYNTDGYDKDVILRFFRDYSLAYETDFLGNPIGRIDIKNKSLSVKTKAYEIKTLLIKE